MTNKKQVRTVPLTPFQEELISTKEDIGITNLLTGREDYKKIKEEDIVLSIISFNNVTSVAVTDALYGVVNGKVTKASAFITLSVHLFNQGCSHMIHKIEDIEELNTLEWLMFIDTQVSSCLSG